MEIVNLTISGAVSGAIYSLLALGLVLAYSTSRIFNFGHAATAFATAYLYYQFHVGLGWNEYLALVAVLVVFAPGLGWVWDRLVFSRLTDSEESTKIVAGIGVLIVVPALVVFICDLLKDYAHLNFVDTAQVFRAPGIVPAGQHKITDRLVLSNDQLTALGVAILMFALLWGLLRFSTLGLRMRAAVDSPSLSRLRGINTRRVSTLSWLFSFFLAGVAGVLAAPFPGPFGLVSDNYTAALFVATTAAVMASLRSVPIAFLAGLAIGALRNLVVAYVNGHYLGAVGSKLANVQGLTGSAPYIILFVVLIAIGHDRKRRKAGTSSGHVKPLPDHQSDLSRQRRILSYAIQGAIVLVPGLFFADGVWRQLIIVGFATAIIFLSFTVVTGLGGMVSLAQGTFATASAITVGLLAHHGLPYVPAVIIGMAVAGALGALAALPAMRLSGLMLTISTLALALLGTGVLFKIQSFTNGPLGWHISRPRIGALDLGNDRIMMVVTFVLTLIVAWVVTNLERSASGRAMVAVRTAEPAAAASAVSPQATKLRIFVISAVIAGLGGALAATVYGTVLGTDNPPQQGFLWLAAVVVFGISRPASAISAGVVFVLFPLFLTGGVHIGTFGWNGTTNGLIPSIIFGLGAITLASQPNGFLNAQQERARARRDRKRHKALPDAEVSKPATTFPTAGFDASSTPQIPSGLKPGAVTPQPEVVLLELDNVHAAYGAVEVLHGISLTVEPGSATAILGANGSGKSTLCSVVAGLVPVTQGRILLDGEDITILSAMARVERGIVLVPESRGVFPSMTVEENLSIWLPNKVDRDHAYDSFEALRKRRNQPAGNLSGGEQQMLSLAPFLVRKPRLLISDEPSLGLAQIVTGEIMAALRGLQAQGTTIILVEEKARDVLTIADHVGALQRGHLQWMRLRADVDQELLAAAYLGMSAVVGADQ